MNILSKICTKCTKDKILDLFPRDKDGILGRHSQCKECAKQARLSKGDGIHAAQQVIWRNNNKEEYRICARISKYKKLGINITKEEYIKALKYKGDKCAICETPPKEGSVLCLDHDHKTMRIRGFLCHDCNIGLGKFKDSTANLVLAVNYLRNCRETDILVPREINILINEL